MTNKCNKQKKGEMLKINRKSKDGEGLGCI